MQSPEVSHLRRLTYSRAGQAFAPMYINHSELAGKKPPEHPRPAREASFYVGRYANDYYDQIRIVLSGSTMHLLIGPKPFDYPLRRHWDGNLFAFFLTGEKALGITAATFTPNRANRHARSVTLEYYDEIGLGTFTRR